MVASPDPKELSQALEKVRAWAKDQSQPRPSRAELAAAVRLSARTVEQIAPGQAVELRIPPFAAVQCIAGPRHTRGTPPNVVQVGVRDWLRAVLGLAELNQAPTAELSGIRAGEVARYLPLVAQRRQP